MMMMSEVADEGMIQYIMNSSWICQTCLKHFKRDLYSVVQINSFFRKLKLTIEFDKCVACAMWTWKIGSYIVTAQVVLSQGTYHSNKIGL